MKMSGKNLLNSLRSVVDLDDSKIRQEDGMRTLREMFPEAKANELNFVLFSTAGEHGSYRTIEEAETGNDAPITFLVVHPRKVILRPGNCVPKSPEDFDFLRRLRESSWEAATRIGRAREE